MTTISISLPDALARRLASFAKRNHTSRSAFVREVLERDAARVRSASKRFQDLRAKAAKADGNMPWQEEDVFEVIS